MNGMDNVSKNGKVMKKSTQTQAINLKSVGMRVAFCFAMGFCGYFSGLAELPFGARPFGVALLAACGRETVFVYFGLVLSAFRTFELKEALIYFAIYSALLLFRIFPRLVFELKGEGEIKKGVSQALTSIFREKIALRIMTASIFGFALGVVMLFSGGLLYYDLFGLFLVTILSPIVAFLVCGYVSGVDVYIYRKKKVKNQAYLVLGFIALCAITVFGAKEVSVYGVSVSVLIGLGVTFFLTHKEGLGYGSLGGLLIGACYSPMLSPIFVFSALAMGILGRFSIALACFTAFFASCAWAFYVLGISALLGVFGGILSACLLYSVIHKVFFADSLQKEEKMHTATFEENTRCVVLSDSALDGVKLYEMNFKNSAVSDGLYKISQIFGDVKYNRTDVESVKICDENYNVYFSPDVSAPEYKALSKLLAKNMESNEDEYFIDKELSQNLCKILTDLRLDIIGVLVYGVRKKTIYIKGKNKNVLLKNTKNIIEAIAPSLPFSVDFESYDLRKDGEIGGGLFIFEREKHAVSVVRRKVVAHNENVCGDNVVLFKNKDDRFFALLSDGMGSGEFASLISKISVDFLENMLTSGGLSEELVEMLNSFLAARMQKNILECSATLDLLELDLMNGRATVYKCGAAPSYIYRRGRLFKMRSQSMPIGILNDVDIKRFELELSRGDVIVMVSDGVTGEGVECPWLFDLLAQNLPNRTLERTAELIVKYATAKGSGDDITVVLLRVS